MKDESLFFDRGCGWNGRVRAEEGLVNCLKLQSDCREKGLAIARARDEPLSYKSSHISGTTTERSQTNEASPKTASNRARRQRMSHLGLQPNKKSIPSRDHHPRKPGREASFCVTPEERCAQELQCKTDGVPEVKQVPCVVCGEGEGGSATGRRSPPSVASLHSPSFVRFIELEKRHV